MIACVNEASPLPHFPFFSQACYGPWFHSDWVSSHILLLLDFLCLTVLLPHVFPFSTHVLQHLHHAEIMPDQMPLPLLGFQFIIPSDLLSFFSLQPL